MPIYLMRHAESLFNTGESNDKDVALSEKGKSQASGINKEVDIVICSPLKRCQQTLQYSQIKYSELKIEPLVREMRTDTSDFLEGEEEIIETEPEIQTRIAAFKAYLKTLDINQSILVLTHSDFIWYLTSYLHTDGEYYGKHTDNCEIIELAVPL